MNTVSSDPLVVETTGLTKDFGGGKGIFDINLKLSKGSVTGFVGPNGSGKSTTINILTGLTQPNSGTLEIFGERHDFLSLYRIMPRIGVMYSEQTVDDHFTARKVFVQSQQLLGRDCNRQWKDMSSALNLDVDIPIKRLSLGNKKKIGIIQAMMHQPDLLIMDEPTSGLDPIISERFVSLIKQAAADGATVLLSSHDLAEVQEVSTHIVMIKAGKIILDDQTDAILNLAQRTFQLVSPPVELTRKLETLQGITNIHKAAALFSFQAKDYEAATMLITSHKFYNFYIEKPSLEKSFRDYYE